MPPISPSTHPLRSTSVPTEELLRPSSKKSTMPSQRYLSRLIPLLHPLLLKPLSLVDAHKRGVKVEAILDKSQRKEGYTEATFLTNMKIPTYIDSKHAIAHNKVMVIDKATVITGSFNFTKAAEDKNAENLLIIKSKDLAKLYLENWGEHREHSEDYQRKQTTASKKKP
jgi:phosphatidylserine/phosphatidylglycerophosphate/cardiolipin synthase-like enzyme